jgi:hypothetical protein
MLEIAVLSEIHPLCKTTIFIKCTLQTMNWCNKSLHVIAVLSEIVFAG